MIILQGLFCLSLAMAQDSLVLTHVTVIDATGAPAKADMTVTIRDQRIVGLSKRKPAKGARVVDATGKFLIPGLWDMHVHPPDKDYLPLFIANGVTGVRVMWGNPDHYEWRKAIEAGQLTGPRMAIASAIVDGPTPYWPSSVAVADVAQARRAVDEAKQLGADFVKVYQFLPRDLYFAIADEARKQGIPFEGHVPISVTAEEASSAGQKSFEHLIGILPACSTHSGELLKGQAEDLAEEIAAGKVKFWGPRVKQSRQLMLDSYSPEKAARLSELLKKNGTWQCPTLTLLHMFGYGDDPAFLSDPRVKYLPASERVGWDPARVDGKRTPADFAIEKLEFQKDLEVVGTMQREGVGILAGTDAGNPFCFPGFGLHDELGFLVKAGLTPMQALQAATLNAARFLGKAKDFGTVEAGKTADLVLLDANPLDDIGNTRKIAGVVFGGKLIERAELDRMLSHERALASRKLISETMMPTIQEKGVGAAIQQYRDLRMSEADAYDFGEGELITLGYELMRVKKFKDAIEVLKLSAEVYPKSYNSFDSLAEAYLDDGQKDLAIVNYRKSVELNPGNANGVRMLGKLMGK